MLKNSGVIHMIAQISQGVDVLLDGAGALGWFDWLGRGFTVGLPLQQDMVDGDDQGRATARLAFMRLPALAQSRR